jgi:hypothetical protein
MSRHTFEAEVGLAVVVLGAALGAACLCAGLMPRDRPAAAIVSGRDLW